MPQSSPPTENSDLFAHTLRLDFPRPDQIESAYADLPTRGRVLVTCRFPELAGVLAALERTGFFGLLIAMPSKGAHAARISAFKGKEGPCYDTGRSATYAGGASAALDDDNHLLFGTSRVCEKTAEIYATPVYADVLQVSEGDPQLLTRLNDEPVAFDCDTFEADVEQLASAIGMEREGEDHIVPILYPGPFRLLVLADGSMLRRGQVTLVSRETAKRLSKDDECVVLDVEHAAGAVAPTSFVDAYQAGGPVFLLGDRPLDGAFAQAEEADLSALYRAPESMIARLRKLIDRQDKYFILTGSDPHDEFGCCPSDDVGVANRLVEAGVLDCWHPPTPPDACPSTVYAFRGEMQVGGRKPSFSVDDDFRRTAMDYLVPAWKTGKKRPLTIARGALLAFVVVSIGFALFGGDRSGLAPGLPSLAAGFDLSGDAVLVALLHRTARCDSCNRMETWTRLALERHFRLEVEQGRLIFQTLNVALPAHRGLARKYGVIGSAVVLVRITNGAEQRWQRLEDAWNLAGFAGSEREYTAMVRAELTDFLRNSE